VGSGDGGETGFVSLAGIGLTKEGGLRRIFGGGSSTGGGTVVVRAGSVEGIEYGADDGRWSVRVRARDWKDEAT
jgi:hypothetical protein